MATTIRQISTFNGTLPFDGVIDMNPELPTESGNLIVMFWMAEAETDYNEFELENFSLEGDIPVEGVNIFAGYGSTPAFIDPAAPEDMPYAGGVIMGPTQPEMGTNYLKLTANSLDVADRPIRAVLLELTSDLGPIVSYASYNVAGGEGPHTVETFDWMAVASGYSKARPVLAFAMALPGEGPPSIDGVLEDDGFLIDENPIENVRVALGDVGWAVGESQTFGMAETGFVGYVGTVVEQSQYETVQHLETENTATIAPTSPISDKNLVILSARYKDDAGPFEMAGWNAVLSEVDESPNMLTTVVFWKQAGSSEPEDYTVPGLPLNLNLREVSGFPDGVVVGNYALLDNSVNTDDIEGVTPEEMNALRLNGGVAVPLVEFPDNDAYFFCAASFNQEMDFAFNMPDPEVHLNKALVDSGDGWDFFPDGFFGVAPITGMGSVTVEEVAVPVPFGSFVDAGPGEWEAPDPAAQVSAVGLIFFNVAPLGDEVTNPIWRRLSEPNVDYFLRQTQSSLDTFEERVNALESDLTAAQSSLTALQASYDAYVIATNLRLDALEA